MPSIATYDQRTGEFTILATVDDGGTERVLYQTRGYAGTGPGRNNPDYEHRRNVGPLPAGQWRVVRLASHGKYAKPVFRLLQETGCTFGRSGFLIHGDNVQGDASRGCIILNKPAREAVENFDVQTLEVFASRKVLSIAA